MEVSGQPRGRDPALAAGDAQRSCSADAPRGAPGRGAAERPAADADEDERLHSAVPAHRGHIRHAKVPSFRAACVNRIS